MTMTMTRIQETINSPSQSNAKRRINVFPPSTTTSPIPTFNPTPAPRRVTDSPTKSEAPSAATVKPQIIREGESAKVSTVTCEHSFQNLDTLFSDVNVVVSDPPLVSVVVDYIYEAYISNDVSDRYKVLAVMEYNMFSSVLNTSPWMNNGVPQGNCTEMLSELLNFSFTGVGSGLIIPVEEDWTHFLGWKIEPPDSFKEGAACVTQTIVDGSTCFPIEGRITAQVPVDNELSPVAIQTQVMNNIKNSVENNDFLNAQVVSMKFIGQSLNEDTGGPVFPTEAPLVADDNGLLSAFGISAICALSAAFLLILGVLKIRHRKNSEDRSFEEVQNDAISLGKGRSDDLETPKSRHVFTELSPDGVEIVDLDSGFEGGGAAPVGDTNTVNSSSIGKKGFNFGSFMDSLRGRDDLSYASEPSKHGDGRSLEDDSVLSVETEDYGYSADALISKRPPLSPRKYQNEI
eukprot:scaffold191_cov273-Chaetoceros_neogracile.AAC.45